MAKLQVFCVQDTKAEAFMRPWVSRTVNEALRNFASECNAPDSALAKFPNDFCLWHVGEFDEETGKVKGFAECRPLGFAVEHVRKAAEQLSMTALEGQKESQ